MTQNIADAGKKVMHSYLGSLTLSSLTLIRMKQTDFIG